MGISGNNISNCWQSTLHGVCVYAHGESKKCECDVCVYNTAEEERLSESLQNVTYSFLAARTRRRSKRLNAYTYLYIKCIHFTPYLYALFIISPLRLSSSANAANVCTFAQYDFFPNESRLIDLYARFIFTWVLFFSIRFLVGRYTLHTRQRQSSSRHILYIIIYYNSADPIYLFFSIYPRTVNNTTICSYRCSEYNMII